MSKGGNNRLIKVLIILLLVPLGVVIPVLTMNGYESTHTQAQADEGLTERIQKNKELLKEEVKTSTQERVKLRCIAVQTNIQSLATRIKTVKTNRQKSYDSIVAQLTDLSKKLDAQAYDTTNLDKNTENLSEAVEDFRAEIDSYKQALDDLTAIDCGSDPVAFVATLEVARSHRENIVGITADIRSDVLNTIKPTLEQIEDALGGSTDATDKEPATDLPTDTPTSSTEVTE